jgi:phage-related minor tail protein
MPKWKVTYEKIKLQAENLVEKVKDLIYEGNVRRIIIKDEKGNTFIEIPVTVAALTAVVAPILAAVGTIATLVAHFTIVVERTKQASAEDEKKEGADRG